MFIILRKGQTLYVDYFCMLFQTFFVSISTIWYALIYIWVNCVNVCIRVHCNESSIKKKKKNVFFMCFGLKSACKRRSYEQHIYRNRQFDLKNSIKWSGTFTITNYSWHDVSQGNYCALWLNFSSIFLNFSRDFQTYGLTNFALIIVLVWAIFELFCLKNDFLCFSRC